MVTEWFRGHFRAAMGRMSLSGMPGVEKWWCPFGHQGSWDQAKGVTPMYIFLTARWL